VGAAPAYRYAVNPPWGDLPGVNAIVGTGLALDYHVASYETALTLKSIPRGVATYSTPRTRYRIGPRSLVVLNAGQRYSLDIDGADRTATLCLFFEPGFVEGVAQAMRARDADLLDAGADAATPAFGMCERLHAKEGAPATALSRLEEGMRGGHCSEAWLETCAFAIAREMVLLDARDRDRMRSMPGLRPSTREETYRRLHWARDFLDASLAEALSVARIARVACMSPYHFHHLFRQAFGETPMQRVQRLRLATAADLLAGSDRSVTRVCTDVGFESLGSFSALFRRRFGASPGEFRRKRRIGEATASRRP
jgi:AraC family transcriptional regulator